MADDTTELVALLDAALGMLPAGPAHRKLQDQFDRWKDRHADDPPEATGLEVASILSHRTKEGLVEMTLGREKVQMDLTKAREVLGFMHGAIEAAVTDQMLYAFLTQKVGLRDDQASAALLDFRELRQGSRGVVYPS
jgi:hypothetical protein